MAHPFLKFFTLPSLLHLRTWELPPLRGDAAAYNGYLPTLHEPPGPITRMWAGWDMGVIKLAEAAMALTLQNYGLISLMSTFYRKSSLPLHC